MNLSTSYLGLDLANPLVVGASPLVERIDTVKRLEDAGAAAVVMHSLFEEQLRGELEALEREVEQRTESFAEALTYLPRVSELKFHLGPDEYLEHLRRLKGAVSIPVIGSLNGVSSGGWIDYARNIQEAGADALELNAYSLAADPKDTGAATEKRVVDAVRAVKGAVTIPVAVKLSPFYSSLPHVIRQLEGAGADGAVLFNRFYQPDIDVEKAEVVSTLALSDSSDLLLRLRWVAILSGRVKLSLGVTGGVHTAVDAVKALMAGADAVQLVSALLQHGPSRLAKVREDLSRWLDQSGYDSLGELRGCLNLSRVSDPSAYERANYLTVLHGRA
ncbi:MAG: dihydroorotate dehydrogenase-like protein [Deltaproteobacteria bacterium]|nr:dihydroorotate dehydrogenase-like protein [Deltaproteobacteria bacterium]